MPDVTQILNQPLTNPVVPAPKKKAVSAPQPAAKPDALMGLVDIAKQKSADTASATNAEAAAEAKQTAAQSALDQSRSSDIRGAYGKEQADLAKLGAMSKPFAPTQDTVKDMIPLFAMVGMMAASFGGKGTSGAGTNIQAALTGMVKGWNEGRQDVVEEQKKIYDSNMQTLKDTYARTKDAFAEYKDNVLKFGTGTGQDEKLQQDLTLAGNDVAAAKVRLVGATAAEKLSDDQMKIYDEIQKQDHQVFEDYIATQHLNLDKTKEAREAATAANGGGTAFGPDEIEYLVNLAKTGNMQEVNSLLGSSFGNAGKANRKAFLSAAIKANLPPEVLSQAQAEYAGVVSGERTLGTQSGRVAGAIGALQETVPLALDASSKVDRSQFPNLNSVENAVRQGTGDTSIVQFNAYNQAVVNDYAQIMRRGGVSTDDASKRANEILGTNFSNGQYEVGLQTLDTEASAVKNGLRKAKDVIAGKDEKPSPTQADRDYVKTHPDQRQNFINHFGVNP